MSLPRHIALTSDICSLAQEIEMVAQSIISRLEDTGPHEGEATVNAALTHTIVLSYTIKRLTKIVADAAEALEVQPVAAPQMAVAGGAA